MTYPIVDKDHYPEEDVDFDYDGGYSLYNWELFFHAPLLIAARLSQNQRFEEAQHWFHHIFDPTDTDRWCLGSPYWRTKPFHNKSAQELDLESSPNLMRFLANRGDPDAFAALSKTQREELASLENQVRAWRKDPFKPHLIARMRTSAYMKTVVMKYLENLIAWGDQLFRRDTMESINEATQLYILAAELLGKRPEDIPPRAIPTVHDLQHTETQARRTLERPGADRGVRAAVVGQRHCFRKPRAARDPARHALLLRAQERQAARVLGYGGRPAV